MSEIKLGCTARDKITGCLGTVVAICEHLHDSTQAGMEGSSDNGFERSQRQWFSIDRLEVVSDETAITDKEDATG